MHAAGFRAEGAQSPRTVHRNETGRAGWPRGSWACQALVPSEREALVEMHGFFFFFSETRVFRLRPLQKLRRGKDPTAANSPPSRP